MEEIWEKLKILTETKKELIVELGERRYALDQVGKQVTEAIDKLNAVTAGISATVAELEEKHEVPKGIDYTLDLEKQEIIYEPVPDRSDD